jgi:hypothetical protein
MTDQHLPPGDGAQALRFSCACTSAAPVAEDPWVAIPQQRKLNDGTKELILNAIQLAQRLDLSAPTIHRHVTELLSNELIREVAPPAGGRRTGVERFYQPNFPVVLAADRAALEPVLDEIAASVVSAFRERRDDLATAFAGTSLPDREEMFEALQQYLFAAATRLARQRLEAAGDLPPWPEHADGSRWIWWAEEPPEREVA